MPEIIKDEIEWKVTITRDNLDCPYLDIEDDSCKLFSNEDDRGCYMDRCPHIVKEETPKEMKARSGELMRAGKMTDAIKLINRVWDKEHNK